jgi:hypothetical protein
LNSGHGRPAAWVASDIVRIEDGRLAEHWDVLQDEATEGQSLSGLPIFEDRELSDMTLEDTKRILVGEWVSVTPEVRPSATRNPDGTLKPFYLSREFKYLGDDRFELTISNWADPYGKVAVARIDLRGHIEWVGEHPIASGAQKVNFVADEAYEVTPMIAGFADLLNSVASAGFAPWQAGQRQSVFGKTFAPFGLAEGRNFMEYDLIYVQGDYLFWGARNVDGRGFDTERNRPTNLQIPLGRKR